MTYLIDGKQYIVLEIGTCSIDRRRQRSSWAKPSGAGHDSRGNPTLRTGADGSSQLLSNAPEIADRFAALRRNCGRLRARIVPPFFFLATGGQGGAGPRYYDS